MRRWTGPADVLGGALLIPMLNGVEHFALLRENYPAASVVAAAIRVESTRTRPGQVVHDSPFAGVVRATADGAVAQRVRDVAGLLEQAGLDVEVGDDEASEMQPPDAPSSWRRSAGPSYGRRAATSYRFR